MWLSPVPKEALKRLYQPITHTHRKTHVHTLISFLSEQQVLKSVSLNMLLFPFAAHMSDSHDHIALMPTQETQQLHVANLSIN